MHSNRLLLVLQLNLVPNRKIVHTDEQLSLEISNAGDGTLLLAGDATEMEKRNSFALISNKNASSFNRKVFQAFLLCQISN